MLQKSNIETCYLERTCLRDSRGSPFGHAYPAAASRPFGVSAPCRPGSARKASANLAREGRFDYLLVESTGISELLPSAEPRLGRRTVLTFPLLPPPQKNCSPPSDSSPDTPTPGGISR